MTSPSPHISVQLLEVVLLPRVHSQLVSTAQVESQPSPSLVLPSSQYPVIGVMTNPSPQRSIQVLTVVVDPPGHVYLSSTAQVESHPSPSSVLPSSQKVDAGVKETTFPSPQISVQILGLLLSPKVQSQPDSTLQEESHPSLSIEFPSSQ